MAAAMTMHTCACVVVHTAAVWSSAGQSTSQDCSYLTSALPPRLISKPGCADAYKRAFADGAGAVGGIAAGCVGRVSRRHIRRQAPILPSPEGDNVKCPRQAAAQLIRGALRVKGLQRLCSNLRTACKNITLFQPMLQPGRQWPTCEAVCGRVQGIMVQLKSVAAREIRDDFVDAATGKPLPYPKVHRPSCTAPHADCS